MTDQTPQLEDEGPLTHKVNVERLAMHGYRIELKLDERQRADLAAFNDLLAVEDFVVDLELKRWHRDGVRVSGHLVADIVQSCAVTLDPVSSHLEADIDARFVPEGSKLARQDFASDAAEIVIDPDGDDVPEVFVPPWLDLGKIVQEFFALEIDPFVRAPSVPDDALAHTGTNGAGEGSVETQRPFEALAALKDKLESGK